MSAPAVDRVRKFDMVLALLELPHRFSGSAWAVHAVLIAHLNERGEAWPSVARIARCARITPRSVQRALAELEQHGALVSTSRPGQSTRRIVAPMASPGGLARLYSRASGNVGTRAEGVGAPSVRAYRVPDPSPPHSTPTTDPSPPLRQIRRPNQSSESEKYKSKADVRTQHTPGTAPAPRRWAPGKHLRTRGITEAMLRTPHALLRELERSRPMSEAEKLRALSAGHQALQAGRNPVALFTHLLRPGSSIPLEAEDAARAQLRELQGITPDKPRRTGWKRVSPGARVQVPRAEPSRLGELLVGVA